MTTPEPLTSREQVVVDRETWEYLIGSTSLREALEARPKNGKRIYAEEDDYESGWWAAMDSIRAALSTTPPAPCNWCGHLDAQHGDADPECKVPGCRCVAYRTSGGVTTEGLREAIRAALNELGVPGPGYPMPVANAVAILEAALSTTSPAPATEGQAHAYTLLVSSIPALYQSWQQSPNDTAARLNGILYAKVTEWVTDYQRATGRPVDSYPLAGS